MSRSYTTPGGDVIPLTPEEEAAVDQVLAVAANSAARVCELMGMKSDGQGNWHA